MKKDSIQKNSFSFQFKAKLKTSKNGMVKVKTYANKYIKNAFDFYNDKFHTKTYAPIAYGLFFLAIALLFIFLNVYFISGGKYSLKTLFEVTQNWDDPKYAALHNLSGDEFKQIKRGWYNVSATTIAGIGMSLAAMATQSLTRNPIAEGSTLGLVQGSIFGVVFAVSMGLSSLFERYMFMIIFGTIASILLLVFVYFSKKRESNTQKIILAGLAIGIIFKTVTFIFKSGDANLNTVSYSYVLGGAEAISSETVAMPIDSFKISIIVSVSLVAIATVITVLNIRGMNLLEIGDERAKNLGSSVLLTRTLNVLVLLLALPASVILVGNMAFLGLFSISAARWFSNSRNYVKVMPFTVLFGILIANLGLQLTEHIPQMNSGIWMTLIGAPYLIYIGLRGLK